MNCLSAQVSSKKARTKITMSRMIRISQASSLPGGWLKGRAASTRAPRSGAPSSATSPARMKMEVLARKEVLAIKLPMMAVSLMRLSRVRSARIQTRRCSSMAAMTERAWMEGMRSTTAE